MKISLQKIDNPITIPKKEALEKHLAEYEIKKSVNENRKLYFNFSKTLESILKIPKLVLT
jgi:hypothetical protein